MKAKYIPFNEFSLKWRFTEEEYNILPEDDLVKIRTLFPNYSKECWNYWISEKAGHFMKVNVYNEGISLRYKNCGWGDSERENDVIHFLNDNLKIGKDSIITFFWNESIAVETTWSIFLKYWTDFCYPSDDSNIIIIHNFEKAVIYVEDNLTIVNRTKYFSRN